MKLLIIEKSDGRRYDILLEMFFILYAQYVLKTEQTPFADLELKWKTSPHAMIKEFKECAHWSDIFYYFKSLPNKVLAIEEKEQMWRDAQWSEKVETLPLKHIRHAEN